MIFRVLLPHLVDNKLGNLWRKEIKFGEEKEVATLSTTEIIIFLIFGEKQRFYPCDKTTRSTKSMGGRMDRTTHHVFRASK